MHKFILTIILLNTICTLGQAQTNFNEYYDAVEIANYIDRSNPAKPVFDSDYETEIYNLLKKYYPKVDAPNYATFKAKIAVKDESNENYNPFLVSFFPDGNPASSSSPKTSQGLMSSLSGLDVTNLARGAAQFLIERASEEINVLFFDKFKEFLKENKEAATLFPSSTYFITNTEPSQYAVLLHTFRDAFKKDISNITNQLDDLLELDRYQKFGKEHPEAYAGLAALASAALLLDNGTTPDVIYKLGQFENPSNSEANNLYASIKLMAILSESIRSKVDGEAWIKTSDFDNDILQDQITSNLFFGLLYQSVEGIKFISEDGSEETVQETLKNAKAVKGKLNEIVEFYKILETEWSKVNSELQDIKKKKKEGKEVNYMEYHAYVNSNLDFIEKVLKVDELLKSISSGAVDITYPSEINDYLRVLRTGNEIYRDVNEENYSAAVVNLVIVYEMIIGSKIENKIDLSKNDIESYLTKKENFTDKQDFDKTNNAKEGAKKKYMKHIVRKYSDNDVEKLKSKNLRKEFKKVVKNNEIGIDNSDFLKYASFMAAMIEADSPEAAKNIIKAAALPAGSFTIKKNSKFNISVQSYLGVYNNFDPDNSISNSWNNKWGVTAPIGVSFNLGLGSSRGKSSLGFMISLLDIGAIVDYEIRADTITTTTEQGGQTTTTTEVSKTTADFKIELGQIFSPGGYLVYSLPGRLPFTFGIGGQYGPGLTQIDTSSGNADLAIGNPTWRWNAFLGFDIPLFTIFNKDK